MESGPPTAHCGSTSSARTPPAPKLSSSLRRSITEGIRMHSRRALLYVPGDDRHKIEKAASLDVDCICMDMEDGVAMTRKAQARTTIARALQEVDFGASEKLTRINSVGTGLEKDDLQAVLPQHPDGIVIPKVEDLKQLQWASEVIE